MVTVKYHDLWLAFEFVSSAAPMENHAYVSLDTGAIYWVSERDPIEEEELPDDLEESDRHIEVPHKNDFDLGSGLALRFVRERLPDQFTEVRQDLQSPRRVRAFQASSRGERPSRGLARARGKGNRPSATGVVRRT